MDVRYALLSAAKNEEYYIESAIDSVVKQTIRPQVWCIVDDGSSDRTAKIVRAYSRAFPFIRLLEMPSSSSRSFGAKGRAINIAFESVKEQSFDFIGIQDGDISFDNHKYYEEVIKEFHRDEHLGISGGYIFERAKMRWRARPSNSIDSVAGAIQMFRRACFEDIGGYTPLPMGGLDWLAEIDARRAGWSVRALPDLAAYHHRPTSSANGRIRGLFRLGMKDASFGSHPLFEVFKCARRVPESPIIAGSAVRLAGYIWWGISGRSPVLPPEKSAYLRQEQLSKLYAFIRSASTRGASSRRA